VQASPAERRAAGNIVGAEEATTVKVVSDVVGTAAAGREAKLLVVGGAMALVVRNVDIGVAWMWTWADPCYWQRMAWRHLRW
jgi:hypothetical protein